MKILVAGGGGFIGGHMVRRLLADGHEVRSVDKKPANEWHQVHNEADNLVMDLSDKGEATAATNGIDWVFNFAADMGGMGFIENNKALCMLSSLINTHLLLASKDSGVKRYFFASSACVYANEHQTTTGPSHLTESDAYPADPEDGYGWEKLFGERMCRHFSEDFGLITRVGRFHNIYGPFGTYDGGREKAPAAACRKIAKISLGASSRVTVWGDGLQIRSFTYIDDCIEGTLRLMASDCEEPLNIGSSESVSIQEMYEAVIKIAGIPTPEFEYDLDAPLGVRGRSSDNRLCKKNLGWEPETKFADGILPTYSWIVSELSK